MKKAEEYLNEEIDKLHDLDQPWFDSGVYDGGSDVILKAIKQAQIDAIEETVKLCAENAEMKLYKSGKQIEVETPILKEQFYEKGNGDLVSQGFAQVGFNRKLCYENEIYNINKDSILNCAEILKQQL